MSQRKGPPYASGLPYLKRSTETYCGANRATWTADDIKQTALTIWHGDSSVRDYYNARVRKKWEYPLPTPNTIPAHPYNQQDVDYARANKVLPPQRNAAGLPILPPPPLPPGFAAPPAERATSPRPINQYPFDFWTPQPWDPEPEDRTLRSSIKDIIGTDENPQERMEWMGNKPDMWPLRDETRWRGGKFLGGGANGCAGLWCQIDANYNVIRQMVVKEVRPKPPSKWRDPIKWRDRIPREIRIHQLIDANRPPAANTRGHRNLIRHHGYRLMMEQRRYRLYLDFCEGSDLFAGFKEHFIAWKDARKVLNNYHRRKIARRERPVVERENNANEEELDNESEEEPTFEEMAVIPEGFIWHVFSQLVDACEVLQTGSHAPAVPDPDWKAITHLDVRLPNVFMQPSIGEDFPNAVLADFGLSFYSLEQSNSATSDNPHEYTWDKPGERYAPEHQFARGTPGNWTQIGEKTDVWSVGAIICTLIANTVTKDGPRREVRTDGGNLENELCAGRQNFGRMDAPGVHPPFSGFFYPAFKRYSEELKALVARCLNWEPEHRPSLRNIRRDIDQFLEGNPGIRDDRDTGPLLMATLEDGLKIDDEFWPPTRMRPV